MKLFLQTSHKTVAFILLFTIWIDFFLPEEYRNSDITFWIWCVFLYGWFYFAFRHLSQYSNRAFSVRIYYYFVLFALLISTSLRWVFGIDDGSADFIVFSFLKVIGYLFLVLTITQTLLELEQKKKINSESVQTFIMVFFLPISAWWIHKRVQKIILTIKNAPFSSDN